MNEHEPRRQGLWSLPAGVLSPDDSIKGFRVEALDGHAGKVSWASYAPGESYLVISLYVTSTRHITSLRLPRWRRSAPTNARCGFG